MGVKTLHAIDTGNGQPVDIDVLRQLTKDLWLGKTFCAHAPGAVEPLQSALKYFYQNLKPKLVTMWRLKNNCPQRACLHLQIAQKLKCINRLRPQWAISVRN